jgi:predicted AAA+ superfamily ATPase
MEGFARFLVLAAVENGKIVNYENIAKFAGIADTTVKAYYQLLIDTLVAYEIPAWHNSLRKQIQKGSRYYLFDNGVINALTGELLSELKPSTYRFGRLFESFIVQQIKQALEKSGSPLKCFHYREYGGLEVDLILQKNPHSTPLAIEIKSSSSPNIKDVKNLMTFKKQFPNTSQIVICETPRPYQLEGIRFFGIKEGVDFVCGFD